MLLFLILSCTNSKIPYQYQSLVDEALKSAQIKTPKELRENTKYPGIYEGEHYHFKLTKTLTNKRTNDVKGFSFNDKNCAIIKRKKYNLTEGFTVIDPQTQNIFLLTKPVFEEDKIIVYESTKINIFNIMTDFIIETSTDQEINDLPIKSIRRKSKRPKAEIKFGYNWNDFTDRPNLYPLQESLHIGVGYSIKIGVSTRLSFKSIWDISISFRFLIEGKFGVEVLVPDDSEIEIEEIELFSKKIAIPSLAFETDFLGLEISIGAFMNFALEIVDIKFIIPLGFDYFKGYKVTSSKYFEITPTSITDSKWETTIIDLPQVDKTKDVFKRILDSTFTATIQIRPFLSLDFNLGAIESSLECGLKFPVKFDFTFNKELCTFPHLHADVSMPIKMYFAFDGLSFEDYELIERAEKEFLLINIILPSFCIGKRRFISDDTGYDPSSNVMYITMDDTYDVRQEKVEPVEKEISVRLYDGNDNILTRQEIPFRKYDTVHKTQHDRFFVVGNDLTEEIRWVLSYFDENVAEKKSGDFVSKKISDLNFKDSDKISIPIELRRAKDDNSDILKTTANIEKVSIVFPNEVYKRKTRWSLLYFIRYSFNPYCLFCIDEEGNREVDNNARFLSYYSGTEDLYQIGDHYYNDLYEFSFEILSTAVLIEGDIKLKMEMVRHYEVDGEQKNYTFVSIITPTLNAENDYGQMPESRIDYPFYIKDNYTFTLYVTVYQGNKIIEQDSKPFVNARLEETDSIYTKPFWMEFNTVAICFYISLPPTMYLVETSHKNPYPSYETLIAIIDMVEWKIDIVNDVIYNFFTIFDQDETTKILKLNVPEEHRNEKLFIVFDDPNCLVHFIDERVYEIGIGMGVIDINGSEVIHIPIMRDRLDKRWENASYQYVTYPPSGMFIVPDGTHIFAKKNVGTLALIPNFYFIDEFIYKMHEPNEMWHGIYYDYNYTIHYFYGVHDEGDEATIYMNSVGLGEDEPSVESNITNLQFIVDNDGELKYNVFSNNGFQIRAKMDGKSEVAEIIDKKATFSFKGKVSNVVFTSICQNETEKVCEIEYPAPNQTGYHLIQYPNRWGISTTGQGFLAEIIPVEKGKSFFYYKTYTGSIKLIRVYSAEPVNITIKIIDQRNANYESMKRTRTICLIDEDGLVVPFSRKFVNNDFLGFLEMIGISRDIDMNYLYNDEEGKIIFDPKYITSNDFSKIDSRVCDLKISTDVISHVDKKDLIFDIGGYDKSQKRKTILLISIVFIIFVVLFAIIILITVLKCRKRCKPKKKESDSIDDDALGSPLLDKE